MIILAIVHHQIAWRVDTIHNLQIPFFLSHGSALIQKEIICYLKQRDYQDLVCILSKISMIKLKTWFENDTEIHVT
jgi:hypothetical protein